MTVDRKSHPTTFLAWYPNPHNRNNPTTVNSNLFPSGLGHVEVGAGRIAPTSIITRKSVIRWTKISGRDGDRNSLPAPSRLCFEVTYDLVALTTRGTIVEQCCAQCRSPSPIPCCIQVSIPTCPSHSARSITASIEGCMSPLPPRSCESIGIDE
nr:Os03g0155566 [Ipomoea batatas]